MAICLNCNNKKAHHIADGLYLCPKWEKEESFHLVRSTETKEIYWKNTNDEICDEELVKC